MGGSKYGVLIVGAGPVGLTMACEAARHGLAPRIVDQAEEPSIYSKAQIVHARTLEILEDMGIVDRFLERGIEVHGISLMSEGAKQRIARINIDSADSHYRGFLSIAQRETELLLNDHLESFGVHVERQVRLDRFEEVERGVHAVLVHHDGREEAVVVPWMVGADGARSTVRKGLGLEFGGSTYEMGLIQADARVDFPFPVPEDEVTVFLSPKAVAAFFPLPGGERRYRFLVPLGGEDVGEPTLERFQEILDRIAPPGSRVSDPKWMVGFRIHCRMTPTHRVGRVFLAGDASHIHSPFGGQGMNMGMHDAYTLAWMLSLVERRKADVRLLDAYDAERHAVAGETLAWTDRATKGAMMNFAIKNPIAVGLRNRMVGFVGGLGLTGSRMSRTVSMLDVAYTESPICREDRSSALDANVVADANSENPSVRAWMAFGAGPAPGTRALDAYLDESDPDSARLFDALRGTKHTLLLFDGAAHTEAGYANLATIAERVLERWGDRVGVYVIVPLTKRPDALAENVPVLLDPNGSVHERYGARSECLYLVRPDGYVGYRCQPADGDLLIGHLARYLI